MAEQEWITVKRDCDATQVPHGNSVKLPRGTEVQLVQSLGSSFTVRTRRMYLLRVDGENADALGLAPRAMADAGSSGGREPFSEEKVWGILRDCYDPEIPVNIVDLGLIYGCEIKQHDDGTFTVSVQMTLTAPGCGMGEILKEEIEQRLLRLGGAAHNHRHDD